MAKKKSAEPQDAPGDATPTAIKVQGIMFPVTARYAEGHVLTAQEALTLNQTLFENLRNNFAAHIRKAVEAKAKAEGTPEGESPSPFTADELNDLQVKFAEYAASYTFSAPRATRAPVDPVEREMRAIAKERVVAALTAKNISQKALPEGKMDEYITSLIERRPEIREEAERRVAARKEIAADILDI